MKTLADKPSGIATAFLGDAFAIKKLSHSPSKSKLVQEIFYNNPDQYPPIINGARLLAVAGFNVEILCRDNGERWNVAYPTEVDVKRIDTRSTSSWKEYTAFIARVWRAGNNEAKAIVAHDAYALIPSWLLAKRFRLPLFYHCHDYVDKHSSNHTLGSRVVTHFQRRFARNADVVIVPDAERSRVMARELRLRCPPVIVANSPLKRASGSGDALRNALADRGIHYERVLFRQGRIGVGHAIESTIQSIPLWANPNWGFVVMGLTDASYAKKLYLQAKSVGAEKQFVVLPAVGYDEVAQFTPGADIGHALYEPIHINNIHITTASNKIMEYMEAGLPLMVSNNASLSELIEKYNCGITANEKSASSIAAAVNALLGDRSKAAAMGAAARHAFEQEFCYDRQFEPVIKALQRCCDIAE